jgi:hypothetical protein
MRFQHERRRFAMSVRSKAFSIRVTGLRGKTSANSRRALIAESGAVFVARLRC